MFKKLARALKVANILFLATSAIVPVPAWLGSLIHVIEAWEVGVWLHGHLRRRRTDLQPDLDPPARSD